MDMRTVILVLLSLILVFEVAESFDYEENDLKSEESMWDLYERWRSEHTESTSLGEKKARFNVFKENLKHIHKVNQMDKPYKLKLNKFADMTNHEFVQSHTSKVKHFRMLHGTRKTTGFMHAKTEKLPTSIDWRKHGAVTDVKNQGHCGSCWAFATVAAVEGINKIKTGQLVSLSEQELLDCDRADNGCDGGLMERALEFIANGDGLATEEYYPYKARDERCDFNKLNTPSVIIDDYEIVPENDEISLMKAVANQPVAVAIDAGGENFQFYSEGVFNGICGTQLNHGVAVVGYGKTQSGSKYWIVRNSWGDDWGEKGYIRIERDVAEPEGLCGITMEASYPIKKYSDNKNRRKDEL